MHFRKLDWNLLVILDQLLQGKSVSDTARVLNLSQPAISNCLARLRLHFEDELFVPAGRRLAPTLFAQSLSIAVRAAVEDIDRILGSRREFVPETACREFTVVCSDHVYSVFLNDVIRRLGYISSGITLKVLLNSDQNLRLLRDGRADFLITSEDMAEPGHPNARLFEDGLACLAWTGNTRVGAQLTLAAYTELSHIGVTHAPADRGPAERDDLDRLDIRRRIATYAPTFGAIGETVVGTPHLATLQTRAASLFAERFPLRVLKLPFETASTFEVLQWHKTKNMDLGVIWLREFILKCAHSLAQDNGLAPVLKQA